LRWRSHSEETNNDQDSKEDSDSHGTVRFRA
jgi:hypothetical protein